jgi:Probable lipoprotein LpqN
MTMTRARTMVALLLTVLAVGCTRDVAGLATGQPRITGTTSACNFVSASLTPVPSRADDEPQVLIPVPSGWERDSEHESERDRFAMRNGSARSGRIAVASVMLRTLVGHHEPAKEFEDVRLKAEKDTYNRDVTAAGADVCGYPAQIFRYTRLPMWDLPMRPEILLMVLVPAAGKTHEVALNITTSHADDPEFRRGIDTIMSGFQVLAPAG